MMTIPTAFLPNTYYMCLIAQGVVDGIYIGEQYCKQSLRNRAELLTANGRESMTVPVRKVGYPSPPSSEVIISEHGAWRHKMWQLLRSSYQSSPYWVHYCDRIEQLLYNIEPQLVAYNHAWLKMFCEVWDFETPILTTSEGTFHLEVINPSFFNTQAAPKRYWQVFEERHGFQPRLSSLDLLLNLGPEGRLYLLKPYEV